MIVQIMSFNIINSLCSLKQNLNKVSRTLNNVLACYDTSTLMSSNLPNSNGNNGLDLTTITTEF